MTKLKELQSRIAELERALGQKQMNIDYLEMMIELAKKEYDIDIEKLKYPTLWWFQENKEN